MAPTRSKKRKSTESTSSVDMQSFPAPPKMIPTKTDNPARTPTNRSPIRKQKAGITMAQKQALIDNLQLEITERARKLRAQYMLQAQGLRTRIEIRVNRIPMALRRAKMGDLYIKHSETSKPAATASRPEKTNSPRKNLMQAEQSNAHVSPSPQRGTKRLSDDICIDKENEDIDNPKKRVRAHAPIPPARTTSRIKAAPSQVLSPRSANSRTLPRSPIRPMSPTKSYLARPVSPLKPTAPVPAGGAAGILTNMVEKAKATRGGTRKLTENTKPAASIAGVGRGKRAVPPSSAPIVGRGRASILSESSESSNSTIVRKPVPAKQAPVKKTVMSTIKQMGHKKAPVVKAPAATASTAGRVLRKRN